MVTVVPDSNIWIDHIRGVPGTCHLDELLKSDRVVLHPWVLGELMLGDLGPRRREIEHHLKFLPLVKEYAIPEVIAFVEQKSFFGKGLSLVDAQILYGTLQGKCLLWTHDKALKRAAEKCGVDYKLPHYTTAP